MKPEVAPDSLSQGPKVWSRLGFLAGLFTFCLVAWGEARPMRADIYVRFREGFVRTWWDKDWVAVLYGTLVAIFVFAVFFAWQARQKNRFSEEKVPRSYFGMATLAAALLLALWFR